MTNDEIKQIFKSKFKGVNIITPEVVGFGFRGDYAYEILRGSSLSGETIYRFSVINIETKEPEHELSKCYHSRDEVCLAWESLPWASK